MYIASIGITIALIIFLAAVIEKVNRGS